MDDILVSVIITTFKRNDFLKRAIDSVVNQTYKNLEIIIVDDNNPDDEFRKITKSFMIECMHSDERIKYIEMVRNSGACEARNKGFSVSKGAFVNFLDDDDMFCKDKIELQLKKFQGSHNSVGVIGCFAKICNSNGNIIQNLEVKMKGDVFFNQLCTGICATPLPLIRREVFEKSGGFEDIPSCQEHLMFAKLFSICPNYDYVDKELVVIYHHDQERISNNKKKPQGAIELSKHLKKYYNRLTPEQIKILELSLNANIINSFVLINDKKNAMIYLRKRLLICEESDIGTLKLMILILLGDKVRRNIKSFLFKIFKGLK